MTLSARDRSSINLGEPTINISRPRCLSVCRMSETVGPAVAGLQAASTLVPMLMAVRISPTFMGDLEFSFGPGCWCSPRSHGVKVSLQNMIS